MKPRGQTFHSMRKMRPRVPALFAAALGGFFVVALAGARAAVISTAPPGARSQPAASPAPAVDPYRQYRYRLLIGGRVVAEFRNGTFPHVQRPPHSGYEAIALDRGITQDTEFQKWANSVVLDTNQVPPASYRKSVILQVYNEAGQPAERWVLKNCWVSHYSALPKLNGKGNAIAIEHIRLEAEALIRTK